MSTGHMKSLGDLGNRQRSRIATAVGKQLHKKNMFIFEALDFDGVYNRETSSINRVTEHTCAVCLSKANL
ncbi:hypothetical protein Bca4012_057741 [Brassica carinata]